MIIAWWDKEHPYLIGLIEDSILPWINANWLEKRPATKEELEMYKKGIRAYKIKKRRGITMGLDMCFYERHWLKPHQNKKGNLIKPSFTIPTEMYGKGKKRFKDVSYITCFVGYFRKANAIHKYMLDKSGYDDDIEFTNGRDLRILKSDILELKKICLELLGLQGKKFKEKAKELLPTAAGFFWGSTEYDRWYREDLRNFVKMANKLHLNDPDVDVIYNADW